jgi:hypothetical protein
LIRFPSAVAGNCGGFFISMPETSLNVDALEAWNAEVIPCCEM